MNLLADKAVRAPVQGTTFNCSLVARWPLDQPGCGFSNELVKDSFSRGRSWGWASVESAEFAARKGMGTPTRTRRLHAACLIPLKTAKKPTLQPWRWVLAQACFPSFLN